MRVAYIAIVGRDIGRVESVFEGQLCLARAKVHDINAVLAAFAQSGRPLLDQVGRPGGRRSLIGFMHPDAMGGVLFHFVQRKEI